MDKLRLQRGWTRACPVFLHVGSPANKKERRFRRPLNFNTSNWTRLRSKVSITQSIIAGNAALRYGMESGRFELRGCFPTSNASEASSSTLPGSTLRDVPERRLYITEYKHCQVN